MTRKERAIARYEARQAARAKLAEGQSSRLASLLMQSIDKPEARTNKGGRAFDPKTGKYVRREG